jgi:hypothetical protein
LSEPIPQTLFRVEVRAAARPFKVPKELVGELKGAVGPRMMGSMRREWISCPVFGKDLPFLVCFNCPNFIRRVRGVVDCAGQNVRNPYAEEY